MLRRIIIIIVCAVCFSGFLFFVQANQQEKSKDEQMFSEGELEFLSQFDGQVIRIGYHEKDEGPLLQTVDTIINDSMNFQLEFITFHELAEKVESLHQGEIDAFLNYGVLAYDEGLSSSIVTSTRPRLYITNINNPLHTTHNLANSHIGFLEGRRFTQMREEILEEDHEHISYFETAEAALEALEDQKIDVFIATNAMKSLLVPRENLQIEFSHRENITPIAFYTSDEEFAKLFESVVSIFRSGVGSMFDEVYTNTLRESLEKEMETYILEKHQESLDRYEAVEIGMHHALFPYSYFQRDGTPTGFYLEIVELFQTLTGIQYRFSNDGNVDFSTDLEALESNDIQFFLGAFGDSSENVINIGNLEVQDNVIAMTTMENLENNDAHFTRLQFGIVDAISPRSFDSLDVDVTTFDNYDLAVVALENGEIDMLLGRRSVLLYYHNVQQKFWLQKSPLIDITRTHGIIGNVANEHLNSLMADIIRLYTIIYPSIIENQMFEQALNSQNRYAQFRLHEELRASQINMMILGIIGAAVATITFFVGLFWKKRDEAKLLKKLTEIDRLTKLYNKYSFKRKCIELIDKYPDSRGVFCFIDLNDFKAVNDTYGHAFGDEILIYFGEMLKRLKDSKTVVFRIAGDEFGIFRIGVKNHLEVEQLFQEIQHKMGGEIFKKNNIHIPINYCVGASIYKYDTEDFSTVMEYADFAMYQAKKRVMENGESEENMELFQRSKYQREKTKDFH